jgi:hypothetical protein
VYNLYRMARTKTLWVIGILLITVSLSTIYTRHIYNNVLGEQSEAPLADTAGAPIVLDFNTPTPTPTPTPTSTPTPTPIPVTAQQLDEWFTNNANHYSVDRSLLWRIAVCESGLRPNAVNWIYAGLFQFSPNTWKTNRSLMGFDTDPNLRFNAEESIRTAAFVLSTRGPGAWPNCSNAE